jgi:hypothetical protein
MGSGSGTQGAPSAGNAPTGAPPAGSSSGSSGS